MLQTLYSKSYLLEQQNAQNVGGSEKFYNSLRFDQKSPGQSPEYISSPSTYEGVHEMWYISTQQSITGP